MDNEKLFDFMSRMYSEMKAGFKKVDTRFDDLEKEVNQVKKTTLIIE